MGHKFVTVLLLLFPTIALASAQGSTITATNYTAAYANQTINQTLSYINQVNQSAYLIFYPDLSKAYSYLAQAQQVYSSSPSSAVSYANQAYSIAQGQYSQINSYRSLSTILLIVMAALVLYWLHVLMKPVKNAESNKKR